MSHLNREPSPEVKALALVLMIPLFIVGIPIGIALRVLKGAIYLCAILLGATFGFLKGLDQPINIEPQKPKTEPKEETEKDLWRAV